MIKTVLSLDSCINYFGCGCAITDYQIIPYVLMMMMMIKHSISIFSDSALLGQL